MVKGIAASSGIAIGRAFVLPSWNWDLNDENISVTDFAKEFERLSEGIQISKHEISNIKKEFNEVIGSEESKIFDVHLAILDDPVFMDEIQGIIKRQYKAAEVAVKEAMDHFTNMFDLLDDEYMRERALDIKDVGNRLLKHLLGTPEVTLPQDNQPFILVAKELSPSQLAHLNPSHVEGILTMAGGKTSHSAIMARALGIPSVLGLEGKFESSIETGDIIVLDGDEGTVYVNPNQEIVQVYDLKKQKWLERQENLQKIINVPAITLDGKEVHLAVNINSQNEVDYALTYDASGVGLFRSEYLYMDRDHFPTEEEQFIAYKEVAQKLGNKPIIIRTLDIGGDKQLDYLTFPEEDNPFLGYRAIRFLLDQKEIFKTQLKAILRASANRNIKIMYPMISSVEEIRKANQILEQAKDELLQKGFEFNQNLEVGIMIEVPAAVAIADVLAQEVDFFSIGTNDLIQYVLAVDRMNEHIADFYEPFHPAVIRMLKQTVDAAKAKHIDISVCGEMAGDANATPIFIGLGVHKLSMSSQSMLQVKERILSINEADCKQLIDHILKCKTSSEVIALVEKMNHHINTNISH
ncbi:phosphoenolpyruvate--protein phosphotransferase [Chengkuizengella axinellae]|uniref:Phosphoenolpyruvate-protein phosphotransferase n=1 Tax=Chengkuizengella axinellae TaxID=3064388 RepID=A0ABT9IWZ9_9BACL|nr:phosphoenolpyruvate--protein phosphotransferase [Chengkuizengella sp. 2205SS18-9]MDP5273315.1 phosphoenolpyruvate--protein phosphotransferase [Chengkuizengella sp. 2205SS18-9]